MNTNNSLKPLLIDSLPAYCTDIYHDDLRCVGIAHAVNVNGLNDIVGDTAGIKLYDTQGKPQSVVIYPKGRKPYQYPNIQGVAMVYGDLSDPIHAVLGLDNAQALYTDLQATSKGGAVVSLPNSLETSFKAVLDAFKPICVYTTHDKPITYHHGDVITHFAPLSVALASQTLAEMMASDDVTVTQGDVWGELAPLVSQSTRHNPYPVEAFGELAGVVRAISHHTQTPLSMAGQSVLEALSTIGQMFVNAPFGYEHKPASLFLLTQAQSGGGKTQVNKLAYKAIYQHDKEAYKEFIQLMDEYTKVKEAPKSKERTEYLATTNKPTNPTITLKDATIESILDRFIMMECHNQSWASDEAGEFFGGYSLKSDTSANALTSYTTLWSNGEAHRMRSSRARGSTYHTNAYHCRITLDLAGQAVIVEPALNDPLLSGQGLLARCLFSFEPSLIGQRNWLAETNPYQDPILQSYWQRCSALLNRGMPYHQDGTPDRHNMPFGKGAKRTLQEYQQHIEYQQAKGGKFEHYTAFASRMAENASRIATLFAFFGGSQCVECEHLQGAFALVEYSINELLGYGELNNEPSDIEKLLAWLVKKCKERNVTALNWSFIYTSCPKPMLKNAKYIKEILEVLESGNYIQLEQQGKAKMIKLNPLLFS